MEPTREWWDRLYSACEEGDMAVIKKMCRRIAETDERVDFDDERWNKILKHVHNIGQAPVVRFMEGLRACAAKADWDFALYHAITRGDPDLVEVLVTSRLADVNGGALGGVTPIYLACELGHMDMVRCLADERADLHALHRQDVTALHIAAQRGNLPMAELLVTSGANVNKRAYASNWTPLHKACYHKHEHVAAFLTENEAKVNLTDVNGNTPLYISCDKGLIRATTQLLERGADTSIRNSRGQMPLHIACIRGFHHIVMLLLTHGCDPSAPQKDGQTPLYLSCLNSHYYSDKCDLALADRQSSLSISSIQKCFDPSGCIISMLLHHGATPCHWRRPWIDFIPKKDLTALEILLEHRAPLVESSLLDFFHHEPLILLLRAGWAEDWCLRLLIRKGMRFRAAAFARYAVTIDPLFVHRYPIFEHIADLLQSDGEANPVAAFLQEERQAVPSLQGMTATCIRRVMWEASGTFSILPGIWALPLPFRLKMKLRMEEYIQLILPYYF